MNDSTAALGLLVLLWIALVIIALCWRWARPGWPRALLVASCLVTPIAWLFWVPWLVWQDSRHWRERHIRAELQQAHQTRAAVDFWTDVASSAETPLQRQAARDMLDYLGAPHPSEPEHAPGYWEQ